MVLSRLYVILLLATFCTMSCFGQVEKPRSTAKRAISAQSAAPRSAVSQQVQDNLIAREKELAAAEQRHATAVIDEALADDFHELATDGRLYAKSDIMPMLKDVVIEDFSLSDFQVFPIDAECVIVTYVSAVKGTYKGQPFPPKNAISSVWVRRHGSWRIVFHQATPIPEKAD